ncbi:MAG: trypsin-like peptidase domain-containing protein, partial [Thermoanaerobaculia bacterium]|nr:trypsin-like peptidase domain-containing protein [Thermoanaerobaculia bacterium]
LALGCRNTPEPPRQADAREITSTISAERKTSTVQVVHEILPSVVNIETEATIRQRALDPWFGLFPRERSYRTQSVGSGFIWSSDGLIVTNAHVVEGASRISVNLNDGRKLPAEVIGVDPDSDLAVLRVDEANLPDAPIGTSSDLLIGETVIAIGNPFGLSGSVTRGVVSALGRSVPSRDRNRTYTDFIQTDASINPGNSGGPLVNIEGKVIGINVAIYAEAQGIGFAIPVDRATKVIEDLSRFGEVHPAWLGLSTTTLTPEEARRRGYEAESGALVTRVFSGSPAEAAGIRPDDVIVSARGTPIDSREALNTVLASVNAGQTLSMVIRRDGRSLTLAVDPVESPPTLGLEVLQEISGIEVDDGPSGIVVVEVARRSRAASIGVVPGDRIVGINGQRIRTVEQLDQQVRRSIDRSSIVLSVARGRFIYTLTFPMGR